MLRHANVRFVLPALLLAAACSPPRGDDDCTGRDRCDTPSDCVEGATECGEGGLYTCNAQGVLELTEACACEASPTPQCVAELCPEGATLVCDGDAIRNCVTGESQSCEGGRCLLANGEPVCATKAGDPVCLKKSASGDEVLLLCSSGDAVATDTICDWRTGTCVASAYDCGRLNGVDLDKVVCDSSGDFLSGCSHGQPSGIVCEGSSKCAQDGTLNCYTSTTAGQDCGGQTVCAPGLHCTQTSASSSACVQPAGILDCNSSDVLSVCSDSDTAVACVEGAVWWWKNLKSWGGSCTNNTPVIPEGGTCIPGLANCKPGLACDKSPYDVAGVCSTPRPGAPAECALTHQVSTGRSCQYKWDSCLNGKQYTVSCQAQSIAGHVITLCSCYVGGEKTKEFGSDAICGVEDVASLDSIAREQCGWTITTTEIAG